MLKNVVTTIVVLFLLFFLLLFLAGSGLGAIELAVYAVLSVIVLAVVVVRTQRRSTSVAL